MRSTQALETMPLIKFEDLSLAMFSHLKFGTLNKTLGVLPETVKPDLQVLPLTSPRLQFVDELPHSDH